MLEFVGSNPYVLFYLLHTFIRLCHTRHVSYVSYHILVFEKSGSIALLNQPYNLRRYFDFPIANLIISARFFFKSCRLLFSLKFVKLTSQSKNHVYENTQKFFKTVACPLHHLTFQMQIEELLLFLSKQAKCFSHYLNVSVS